MSCTSFGIIRVFMDGLVRMNTDGLYQRLRITIVSDRNALISIFNALQWPKSFWKSFDDKLLQFHVLNDQSSHSKRNHHEKGVLIEKSLFFSYEKCLFNISQFKLARIKRCSNAFFSSVITSLLSSICVRFYIKGSSFRYCKVLMKSSATSTPTSKTSQADCKRKLSLPASTHSMTTRQQLKRKLSKAQLISNNLEKADEDPDIRKLDEAEEMEKMPGWRPPARKKRVVVEPEDEEEDE